MAGSLSNSRSLVEWQSRKTGDHPGAFSRINILLSPSLPIPIPPHRHTNDSSRQKITGLKSIVITVNENVAACFLLD